MRLGKWERRSRFRGVLGRSQEVRVTFAWCIDSVSTPESARRELWTSCSGSTTSQRACSVIEENRRLRSGTKLIPSGARVGDQGPRSDKCVKSAKVNVDQCASSERENEPQFFESFARFETYLANLPEAPVRTTSVLLRAPSPRSPYSSTRSSRSG